MKGSHYFSHIWNMARHFSTQLKPGILTLRLPMLKARPIRLTTRSYNFLYKFIYNCKRVRKFLLGAEMSAHHLEGVKDPILKKI